MFPRNLGLFHGLSEEARVQQEAVMSDYRDPYNRGPMDPTATDLRRSEMRSANSGLGWIAGALFLVVVLALIFGLGRTGDHTAGTGTTPPAATTGAAPPASGPGAPATAPRTTPGSGQ
jgi:hypothetical protein